MQKLSLYNGAH